MAFRKGLFVCFSLKGWWWVQCCWEQGFMFIALRRSYFQSLVLYFIQEEGPFPGFLLVDWENKKILTLHHKAGYQHGRNLVQTEWVRMSTPCSSGFALRVFIDLNFKAGSTNSHASICCPGGSAEDPHSTQRVVARTGSSWKPQVPSWESELAPSLHRNQDSGMSRDILVRK